MKKRKFYPARSIASESMKSESIKKEQGILHPCYKLNTLRYKAIAVIFCIVCFFAVYTSPALAETGYVSDMLFLTVRQGPGKGYKVLKTLKSNDPVEILKKQDNYYKIRTDDGVEGWVEQQYITDKFPQTLIVANLRKKIAVLEEKNKKLADYNAATKEKIRNMQSDFKIQIAELNSSLQSEIKRKNDIQAAFDREKNKYESFIQEAGGGSVRLIKENRILKQKNKALSLEIDKLAAENENCLRTGMIQWFLAGAGVLFAGWLIGQSIKRKRRSSSSLFG